MAPTIAEGDGYLLVPADSVEAGDVVTFRSPDGDDYVTHRVVATTPDGYVTKGDANPSSDQSAGAPPVSDGDVVGEVLTVAGAPVVIPNLGTAVRSFRANALPVTGVLLLLAIVTVGRSQGGRDRDRPVPRAGTLVVAILAVGLVAGTVAVAGGARTQGTEYVATETPSGGSNTLQAGTNRTETYRIERRDSPLTRVVVRAEGMAVENVTRNATAVTVRTRVSAPDETGPFAVRLGIYRYPAILPAGVTHWLVGVHPLLAAIASVAASLSPLTLVALTVDRKRPLRASRRRWIRTLGGEE